MSDVLKFNVNGQQLLVADGTARSDATAALDMDSRLQQLISGKYAGRSLVEMFASEIVEYDDEWQWLQARVQAGEYSGMLPFDYIPVTLTSGFNLLYEIGHIDPYTGAGNTEAGHHVAMVPKVVVPVSGTYAVNGDHIKWNTTGKNQGTSSEKHPWKASTLYTWMNGDFYNLLPQKVRNRIVEVPHFLEERYNASTDQTAATGWSWASPGKVWAPSCIEVYGHESWGTKGYSDDIDCQFDVFKSTRGRIRRNGAGRADWWLRVPSGVDATDACLVNASGIAYTLSTAHTYIYPLPCFYIG